MRTRTLRRQFGFDRALGRAGVVAAALYLAFVQVLTAAHAYSGQAMAPDHNQAACVFHFAADRSHAGLPSSDAVIVPPLTDYAPSIAPASTAPFAARIFAPPPRGPPAL